MRSINRVITNGFMPPWKADTGYRHFINENILSDKEKAAIIEWIGQGGVIDFPGNNLPKENVTEQKLGKPDIVMSLKEPFLIAGDNHDKVVQFILPINLDRDTDVALVEFVPGNTKIIHHSNPIIYEKPDSVEYNLKYSTFLEPGYESEKPFIHFQMKSMLYYGGWLPGSSQMTFPDSVGFRLAKKSIMALVIHYSPTAKDAFDQSRVNIYFSKHKVTRKLYFNNYGTLGGIVEPFPVLVIPPDSIKSFYIRYKVKEDMTVYNCQPHMHLIGEKFTAFVVDSNNDTIPLIKIAKWDFRWQEFYKFVHPVRIPKGAEIVVEATYNNSKNNINNPFNPPKMIRQGALTSQEMLSLTLSFTNYQAGDEKMWQEP